MLPSAQVITGCFSQIMPLGLINHHLSQYPSNTQEKDYLTAANPVRAPPPPTILSRKCQTCVIFASDGSQ